MLFIEKENLNANGQNKQARTDEDLIEKNSALAKEFIAINENGKVSVIVADKDKVTEQEKIALYLIGNKYAKHEGLRQSEYATIDELSSELGIPKRSAITMVTKLINKNIAVHGPRKDQHEVYAVAPEAIEPVLKVIKAENSIASLAKMLRRLNHNEDTEKGSLEAKKQKKLSDNCKGILEQNSALAKEFVAINENGKAEIIAEKGKLTEQEKIILHLVGRHYAKYAGLAESEYATIYELMPELGSSYTSVAGALRALMEKNIVVHSYRKERKATYAIDIEAIEPELKSIKKKIENKKPNQIEGADLGNDNNLSLRKLRRRQ